MKKVLIILFVSLLCFGCSRTPKNITINVYENSDKDKVELKDNIEKETKVKEAVVVEKGKEENSSNETKSETNIVKEKAKETYNSAKTWYSDNKDEIKEINSELLQESIDAVTNTANKAKTWYDDNKENIKETAKEKYNSAKNTLKNLFSK